MTMLPTLPMSSNGDSNTCQEKNWTHAATLYLLELIKERKCQLLRNSIASGKKIEVWRNVADLMRQKGFLQTENTVMKKFYNMRRTYSVILKHKKMMASEGSANKEWQKLAGNKGKRWSYYNLMSELMDDETEHSAMAKVDSSSTEETFRNLLGAGTEILLQEVEGLSHTDPGREMEMYAHSQLLESSHKPEQPVIVIKTPRSRTIQFHSVSPDGNLVNSTENLPTMTDLDRNTGVPYVNNPPQHLQNSSTVTVQPPQENHAIVGTSCNIPPVISVCMPNVSTHVNPSYNSNNNVSTTTLFSNSKARPTTYRRPAGSRPNIAITNKRSRLNEELLVEEVQGMRQEVRGINRNLEKLVDVHNRLNDNLERFLTAIRIRID